MREAGGIWAGGDGVCGSTPWWGVWVPMSLVLDGHWLAFHKSHGPESQELLWSTYNGSYRQCSITLWTKPWTALSHCKSDYIVYFLMRELVYFLMRELKCIEESSTSLFANPHTFVPSASDDCMSTSILVIKWYAGFLCETNTCNHWWCAANLRTAIFNWGMVFKHCQRHNGPEGWVHLAKVISQVQTQILIEFHLQNLD